MVSIDINGGLTFQGPATPAQQAKLAGLLIEMSEANKDGIAKMPELMRQVEQEQQAAAEARKKAAATKAVPSANTQKGK
jgi:DNA-binding protein H-NS